MRQSLERAAPAKINLALHVTGRRADGYHLIETLVVFTRHGDRLRVAPAERDSFTLTGPYAARAPEGPENLVIRARDLMRRRFGGRMQEPVAITLEKNLPVAAGIGGGSSDAAAALALLAEHWKIDGDLARIGLELGADIPMCLAARPLVARGIGEVLEPLPSLPAVPLLLVNPGVALATPDVFAALEKRENPPLPPSPDCRNAADLARWLEGMRNDLEAPALSLLPVIGHSLAALRAEGALIARMSGSGATCFGLFGSAEHAEEAAKAIARRHPQWFVQATETMPAREEVAENV